MARRKAAGIGAPNEGAQAPFPPDGEARETVKRFAAALRKRWKKTYDHRCNWEQVRKLPEFQALQALGPDDRREALLYLLENPPGCPWPGYWAGGAIHALGRGLSLRPEDARRITAIPSSRMDNWPVDAVLVLLVTALEGGGDGYREAEFLRDWRAIAGRAMKEADDKAGDVFARLLRVAQGHPARMDSLLRLLARREHSSRSVRAILEALRDPTVERQETVALLALLATAGASEPTQRWTAEAREVVAHFDRDVLRQALRAALAQLIRHRPQEDLVRELTAVDEDGYASEYLRSILRATANRVGPDGQFCLHYEAGDLARDLARGALWLLGLIAASEDVPELSRYCLQFARSHQEVMGNAAAIGLSLSGIPEALAALQTLNQKVTHKTVRKSIAKALERFAKGEGTDAETLQDRAAETFGLDGQSSRTWSFGGYTARLSIEPRGKVALAVEKAAEPLAAPAKTLPAEHPDEWREIQAAQKALSAGVSVQKARLEEAMVSARRWKPDDWEACFRAHPVLGHLGRRLLWGFYDAQGGLTAAVMPAAEGWRDAAGQAVSPPEGGRLGVVHPLELPPEALAAWQGVVVREGVTQPFKQVFRETYVLTPAEERTRSRSNRFAGHVIRANQLYALAKVRGWSGLSAQHETQMQGYRDFKAWNVRAWLILGDVEEAGEYDHLYVTLDQVCFALPRREWHGNRLPLAEVPAVAFSEAMRDVDLFVGAGSIGTEESYEVQQARERWRATTAAREAERRRRWEAERARFEAQQAARGQVRAAMLRELIPVLGLTDRVTLDGHFAFVQGTRARYRLHLGSGNIHLQPSGRYLCIVPSRSQASQVHLPFEEEDLKTAEILSKVMLLADDRKIRDRSILAQIPEGRSPGAPAP